MLEKSIPFWKLMCSKEGFKVSDEDEPLNQFKPRCLRMQTTGEKFS